MSEEEECPLLEDPKPSYNLNASFNSDKALPEDRNAHKVMHHVWQNAALQMQRSLQKPGGDMVYTIHKDVEKRAEQEFKDLRARTHGTTFSRSLSGGASWRGKLEAANAVRRHHLYRLARSNQNAGSLFIERSFLDYMEHFAKCYSYEHDDIPLLERSPDGATTPKTCIIFVKAFVGSAMLFLPAAVAQAGLVYGAALMALMCAWMLDASLLLFVSSVNTGAASFGELARTAVGPALARVVDLSMCLGQFGYCVTYFIFVSQAVGQAGNWLLNCAGADLLAGPWPAALCLLQLAVYVPLSLVRPLSRLAAAMLVADALLVACLAYLYAVQAARVARAGPAAVPWLIGPSPLSFVGTAAYVFEGVGLVLPIVSSMATPQDFPAVLSLGMGFVLVLFVTFAALGALAFGPAAQPTILLNLSWARPESPAATVLELTYCVIVMLTFPLGLYPGVEILDRALGVTGAAAKTRLRCATVVCLSAAAILFSSILDVYIALVGAFACIPLGFIYPAVIHYRVGAETAFQRAKDVAYAVLGTVLVALIATEAVRNIARRAATQPFTCVPH